MRCAVFYLSTGALFIIVYRGVARGAGVSTAPGAERARLPVFHGKIAPLKNRWGVIFSQTAIVKHSPLGDLFPIAVCEKIAPL